MEYKNPTYKAALTALLSSIKEGEMSQICEDLKLKFPVKEENFSDVVKELIRKVGKTIYGNMKEGGFSPLFFLSPLYLIVVVTLSCQAMFLERLPAAFILLFISFHGIIEAYKNGDKVALRKSIKIFLTFAFLYSVSIVCFILSLL